MSDVLTTYPVIARSLASYPALLHSISQAKRDEPRARDEFVNVNDYAVEPQDYDVLLTDISDSVRVRPNSALLYKVPRDVWLARSQI